MILSIPAKLPGSKMAGGCTDQHLRPSSSDRLWTSNSLPFNFNLLNEELDNQDEGLFDKAAQYAFGKRDFAPWKLLNFGIMADV